MVQLQAVCGLHQSDATMDKTRQKTLSGYNISMAHGFPLDVEFRAESRSFIFAAQFQHFRGISQNMRND